jgi:hypothetical protein
MELGIVNSSLTAVDAAQFSSWLIGRYSILKQDRFTDSISYIYNGVGFINTVLPKG